MWFFSLRVFANFAANHTLALQWKVPIKQEQPISERREIKSEPFHVPETLSSVPLRPHRKKGNLPPVIQFCFIWGWFLCSPFEFDDYCHPIGTVEWAFPSCCLYALFTVIFRGLGSLFTRALRENHSTVADRTSARKVPRARSRDRFDEKQKDMRFLQWS